MKEKIAKDLLKIQAVFLRPDEPFTWASGIKSPIYCDNRLTLSDHQVRLDVENGLAAIVKENYPEVEALMGTSTAGIAHAAITAHLMVCLWAMFVPVRRIMGERTRSKESSCLVRRWL